MKQTEALSLGILVLNEDFEHLNELMGYYNSLVLFLFINFSAKTL
jgi:hypothetical protein